MAVAIGEIDTGGVAMAGDQAAAPEVAPGLDANQLAAGARFGDPVPLVEQATRLEFAGGVTAKLTANWSLYAQGGYQFAAGEPSNGIRRDAIMGDVGMRYN